MTSGMEVGCQIRLAMSAIKRDPELKRQIEKLESLFGKESGAPLQD